MNDVGRRLAVVRARIAEAGGDLALIRIVAVTKGFEFDAVRAAIGAGLTDIGENYMPEMLSKMRVARSEGLDVRWHFLGHVQRNKVRLVADGVHLWQGVDRAAAGEEIARRAPGASALVQVNLAGDPNRNGCTFEDAPGLVARLAEIGLDVQGLMGVAPMGDPEDARPGFRRLCALARELGLREVSTGMTDDLEVAVEEGSTMVRVGTALFGPRAERSATRR